MRLHRTIIIALWSMAAAAASGQNVVLYDGSLGTTPNAQGWIAYADNQPLDYYTTGAGATTLDTTANNDVRAGFSSHTIFGSLVNSGFPSLDRAAGFGLRIDVKINSESHTSTHRAGFSIILLDQEAKGIELGFWANEVWAQHDGTTGTLHTKGETVAFDTTAAITPYLLSIVDNTYTLTAPGMTPLSGSIRDYSAAGAPYVTANYLFIGDNTTSASGSATFSYVSIVPEPATLGIAMLSLVLLARNRSRKTSPTSISGSSS
jgi:hypothetical protein